MYALANYYAIHYDHSQEHTMYHICFTTISNSNMGLVLYWFNLMALDVSISLIEVPLQPQVVTNHKSMSVSPKTYLASSFIPTIWFRMNIISRAEILFRVSFNKIFD